MNRKLLFALCILGLCASAAIPPPPTPQPTPAKVSPVAQSEADLRELIVRLIPIGMFGNVGELKPDIVLGRLPPQFPSELKLPAGARVLGGIFQDKNAARAAIDMPQSPNETVAALKTMLLAAGWTEPPQMMPGGFQTMPQPAAMAFLCKSKDGPGLSIMADTGAKGTGATLMLNLDTYQQMPGPYTPCNSPDLTMPNQPPKLPTLTPPIGVRSRGGGGGGSDLTFSSYITLDSNQPVADLRVFYDGQLQRAGWTRTTQGADGPVAWSVWRFNDDKGRAQSGILFVNAAERNGTPTREVTLQITVSR